MPDGVVQWVDPKRGEAQIMRGGQGFRARVADIEPVARHAGARVHFEIHRSKNAVSAVAVRLREGTRVSHHQHRYGTLAGARYIDTKGRGRSSRVHPELAGASGLHPLVVARAWATSVARGDVAGAAALYASDAVIHEGGEEITGRARIQAWLEANQVLRCMRHARIAGSGNDAMVTWESTPGEAGCSVRCRIAHGQLVAQWVTTPPMAERVPEEALVPTVMVATAGDVSERDIELVKDRVVRIAEGLSEPVLLARVKLSVEPDPARARPAVAQASLDVNGTLVRAHVAARTMEEARDLLEHRLRDQLGHLAQHRERLNRTPPASGPGEWRHGDLPTHRPSFFDRPPEERQLVRHKTFAIEELTPDEAVFDMEQLDYDFYLFRDLASGADSLIERVGDGSYRLVRLEFPAIDVGPTAAPVQVADIPVPALTLDDAIERLNVGGEPFVFFVDAGSGRGNVVYRRYDGHYGLITSE
jgi:hypothetical protein